MTSRLIAGIIIAMEICANILSTLRLKNERWIEVEVPSRSEPGKIYRVARSAFGTALCECEGFKFRGHCSHIDAAYCDWMEGDEPKQTEKGSCPYCGGRTVKFE